MTICYPKITCSQEQNNVFIVSKTKNDCSLACKMKPPFYSSAGYGNQATNAATSPQKRRSGTCVYGQVMRFENLKIA